MSEGFQSLHVVKDVLILHVLRQQLEADLKQLSTVSLHVATYLNERLQAIHSLLLNRIAEHKRLLRRHGVRVIQQQKTALDYQIAYVERGYHVQHCFLLATLKAEAQLLFRSLLEGGTA